MGTVYPSLDDKLQTWISAQPMFFVATAPTGPAGHVNVSPKGGPGTFRILGPLEVAYVDFFGSGVETIAHLKQNGRMVMMFCAFEGSPKVVRLHGRGDVVEMSDPRFPELYAQFDLPDEARESIRSIITLDVHRVADSCGYVVPEMTFKEDRRALHRTAGAWIKQRGPSAIRDYCDVNNGQSIDGLPGLTPFGNELDDEQRSRISASGRSL
jgi:hypothetical protein